MMPECDLDDNDPLSLYLKKAPMGETPSPEHHAGKSVSLPADNRTDSISNVRQRSENINHSETDIEKEKVKETGVSKQTD